MIGNAAAALHGARVTTLDIDFMFRGTPSNVTKLKKVARELNATIFRPYYPVSGLYRLMHNELGLQLDFLTVIHGVRSFESLRSRAHPFELSKSTLLVADMRDIIKSKRAAGRKQDRAVMDALEAVLDAKKI